MYPDAFMVRYPAGAGERSPWDRKDQLEEYGAKFAKTNLKEMCEALDVVEPSINPFRRSDIWFPDMPQIVIITYQSWISIEAGMRDVKNGNVLKMVRIFGMDRGEFGIMNGLPYFLTPFKVFSDWDEMKSYPFVPMIFPGLPMEIQ